MIFRKLSFLMLALALLAGSNDVALAAGSGEIDPFVYRFSIFVIAIFVGYYVVWKVTPALHTPLMAVTNAVARGTAHARARPGRSADQGSRRRG